MTSVVLVHDVEAPSIDEWVMAGGRVVFDRTFDKRSVECTVTYSHSGNFVSASFKSYLAGDAFKGALNKIGLTIGNWRANL